MADAVDRALRWVIAASLAAAALLAALSRPTIRVLFERFSFETADTSATAAALFFFAFAVPIWGALSILTRAFYARRDMWVPVLIGTVVTALAIPTYWLLQRSFGLEGVAFAGVVALGAYTIALAARWYRDPAHAGRIGPVLDAAGRAFLPAAIGGFAAFGVAWLVTEAFGRGFIASALALVLGVGAFAAAALTTTTAMWNMFGRPAANPRSAVEGSPPPLSDDQLGG